MATQIAAAVDVALAPASSPEERKGAYDFLEQVKNAAHETWTECFRLFLAKDDFGPQARLAALQVVDEAVGNGKSQLDAATLMQIKDGFLDYISNEFVHGQGEASNLYLKNKIVHSLFLIFLHTYESSWTDFFSTFSGLIRAPSASSSTSPTLNPATTDLFLRLLHEISIELSDSALRLNKPFSRISKDAQLRDAVRARDAPAITSCIFQTLRESQEALSNGAAGPIDPAMAENLVNLAVQAAGDYVAWVDINLIITPDYLPLLFQALTCSSLTIRITAVDAFIEVAGKGMPAAEKMSLYSVLTLKDMISQLLDMSDNIRSQAGGFDSNEEREEHFREKLAKLLAVALSELTKICDDSSASDSDKAQARESAFALGSLVLRFLGDPVDDITLVIIPSASTLLSVFKKEKKRNADGHLTVEKRQFLSELLQVTIRKMQYGPDADWVGAEDDPDIDEDEFKRFENLRRQLKILFDAVAWISDSLFHEICLALLASVVDTIDASGPEASGLSWQQVELATWVLYCIGDAAKGSAIGPISFVDLPPDVKGQARKDLGKVNLASYPPSPLGRSMMRVVQSKVTSFPHPSASLQFFECCVRYSEFFTVWPESVPQVLEAFLDQRGLYQPHRPAQLRAFYLFHKFLLEIKEPLRQHLTSPMLQQLMAALQPLMTVPSDIKLPEGTPLNEAVLDAAVDARGGFDKRLYLFESVGTLTVILGNKPEQQTALLNTVIPPLLDGIRSTSSSNIASMDDFIRIVRLHNLILALANTAKGLPQYQPKSGHSPNAAYVEVYKNAATVIIETLRNISKIAVIRNAALSSFKIISSGIGPAILDLIPPFIETVVGELTPAEIVDFLPFISLLVNRFRDAFAAMLDLSIGQILSKVYSTLEQPVQGTDDEVRHSDLKRAYFNLLLSISTAGYAKIFVSPRNHAQLETLFMSVLHYTSAKESKPLDQKLGIMVLTKFALLWLQPSAGQSHAEVEPIPGIERFFYDSVLPICFDIPLRKHFDYSDAHSYAVLTEIAVFIKTLELKRKEEATAELCNRCLPSVGFPSNKMLDFVKTLSSCEDGKAFRKYFNPLMSEWKKALNDAGTTA